MIIIICIVYNIFINRPKTTTLALNYILHNWQYSEYVDNNKIGIVGHSLGGYTALTLAGAKPNFLNICAPTLRKLGMCNFFVFRWYRKYMAKYNALPNDFYDNRIKAIVLMAPAGELFNTQSFKYVNIPVLMLVPEKDEVLLPERNSTLIANYLPQKPRIFTLKGAAHYSFLPVCDKILQKNILQICVDHGVSRAILHNTINSEVYDFFQRIFAN